jgi:chorismate mutase
MTNDAVLSRAALVREATRFKPTRSSVDVPSRNTQVIQQAISGAGEANLPRSIALATFTAILNSSIAFELCVVSLFFLM